MEKYFEVTLIVLRDDGTKETKSRFMEAGSAIEAGAAAQRLENAEQRNTPGFVRCTVRATKETTRFMYEAARYIYGETSSFDMTAIPSTGRRVS